jgi:hypothetical protein
MKTVHYCARICNKKIKLAHSQDEKDKATPRFLGSLSKAKNRAYWEDKPNVGFDLQICQLKGGSNETVIYGSRQREGVFVNVPVAVLR